jgi:diaminopimelate decarboxylase
MTHSTASARATQKTRLVLDYITAHKNDLPTPLYLYSELALNKAVAAYRDIFPNNAKLFYSLKANPQPGIVQHLSSLGLGAEITGKGELDISNNAGMTKSSLLVGGVSKSEQFLTTLCHKKTAAIVIESETEWNRLKKVAHGAERVPILLRINPGKSFGGLNMAGGTQFGLSPEQGLLIAQAATSLAHIEFLGLHFYFGSQRLTVAPIIQAINVVEEIIEFFRGANLDLKVVDIGLGCGVPYVAKDSALDMSALRQQLWLRWQSDTWLPIEIWAEAGRALVASAGYFVARVTERKCLHGKTFVFLDGGLNVHNPGVGLGRFFRSNPVFLFITATPDDSVESIDIVGNLCTSADCFGQNVEAPRLSEGDLVVISNAGAYCQTTALWGFNSQPSFEEAMLMGDGTLKMLLAQHCL